MEEIPRLPDEYLVRAKELALEHRNDSNCKLCYKRGYQGVNQNNLLVPCSKCVDNDALVESWRTYVRETPELKELYGDYFEEEVEEGEEGEEGEEEKVEEGEEEKVEEGEKEKA